MPERSKAFRLTESLLQLRTLLLSLSLLHQQCSFRVCYGMGRVCEQNANGVLSVAQSPFLPGSKVTRPLLHSVTREQMRPWLTLLHHLAPHLFRQVTEPRGHLCLDPGHRAGEVSWNLQVCVCVCIREKERERGGEIMYVFCWMFEEEVGFICEEREVENWIIGVNTLSLVKDITLKIWALLGVDESFSRWAQPLCVLYVFLRLPVCKCLCGCVFLCMIAQWLLSNCLCFFHFTVNFNCPMPPTLGLPQGLSTHLHTHFLWVCTCLLHMHLRTPFKHSHVIYFLLN